MGKHHHRSSAIDDNKHEQGLQAVLLADSFTKSFRPLSLDQSKVLCPLNNFVLLDYALEFLAAAGVMELVVVCLKDEVETHVTTQHRNLFRKRMSVVCVKDATLTNAGDALRELDKRNLIQSDPFILMHGDVVTNVDLQPALLQHKMRHKKDSSAIMTLLFQKVGSTCMSSRYSDIRAAREDLLVGFDPVQENRILVYDDHSHKKSLQVPCSFFASHPSVELHSDLLDCGIDICSPEVLARFSDEFDYRDIRREFVSNSVAEEEEGLQHKLYAYLLNESEYAARVHDFATYHHISRDLLQRWCYPVVPDNLPSGYERDYRYALQRHGLYREQRHSGRVGRSSTIKGPGMIGSHCFVGENCRIVNSILGNKCHIANGVTIEGCHLWGDNVVEEGATVRESILGHECVIRAGATVDRGCIIGNGCIIGTNIVLPEFTRITKAVDTDELIDADAFGDFEDSSEEDEDESSEEEEDEVKESEPAEVGVTVSDHDIVGPDGIGRVWLPSAIGEDDQSDEEEDEDSLEWIKVQSIGYNPSDLYQKRLESQQEGEDAFSDEEEPLDDHADFGAYPEDSAFTTFATTNSTSASNVNEHGVLITGRQRGVDVIKELKAICMEHEVTSPVENLAIELNSFKFSQNATYSDCTMAATLTLLEKMKMDTNMSNAKLVTALKQQLEHWSPLLRKMSIGIEEEKSIVMAVETAATTSGTVMGDTLSKQPAFRFVLQTLHDEEVVSEEAILSWAAERKQTDADSPLGKLFHQQPTQDFLEWLEEESEEEEDDDDSDEDEDSD